MAAAVNYKGIEGVCAYIKQTQRNYFAVYQAGKLNQPVFKFVTGSSNAKAIEAFRNWAEVILSGDPSHPLCYEIRMYESVEGDNGEEGAQVNIKAGRQGLSATFCLSNGADQPERTQSIGAIAGYISPELMQAKLENQQLLFEKTRLEDKMAAFEARLMELEEGDDEEDEDPSGMGAITEHPLVKMFLPMIQHAMSKPADRSAINGIPAENDTLSQAIAILQKNDPTLADDLMRLAKLSESNKGTFQYLLDMLRKM